MRTILLSLALLTTVTSEEFDTKKHRPLLSEGEPQFWFARDSHFPWDLTHFEFDQSSKDKDVRRFQHPESSLNRIAGLLPHNFNRFLNNPNLPDVQENPNFLDSNKKIIELNNIDKRNSNFLTSVRQDDFSKAALNQEKLDCIWKKCSPKFQNWRLLEPFYVEEPSWIQLRTESYDTPLGENEPFFVARGKRSLKLINSNHPKTVNVLDNASTVYKEASSKLKSRIEKRDTVKESNKSAQIVQDKNKRNERVNSFNIREKIIQKRSDNESQKLIENIEKSLFSREGLGKNPRYLHPRNKHSDILEILEEPFFISRGKKSFYYPNRDFSVEDYYWNQYLDQYMGKLLSELEEDTNFPEMEPSAKEKLLERILNNESRRKRVYKQNTQDSEASVKRSILDELNLQKDPFYVARG